MRSLPLVILLVMFPALANACMMKSDEKASLFRMFDTDKDGFISKDEYLIGEQKRLGRDLTDVERKGITERYNDMDRSGAGMVKKNEFDPVSLQKCM